MTHKKGRAAAQPFPFRVFCHSMGILIFTSLVGYAAQAWT